MNLRQLSHSRKPGSLVARLNPNSGLPNENSINTTVGTQLELFNSIIYLTPVWMKRNLGSYIRDYSTRPTVLEWSSLMDSTMMLKRVVTLTNEKLFPD